jgi:hypothetical protein
VKSSANLPVLVSGVSPERYVVFHLTLPGRSDGHPPSFPQTFRQFGYFVVGLHYLVGSYAALMLLGSFLLAACQHIQP